MTSFLAKMQSGVDSVRIQADIIAGKIQAMKGLIETNKLSKKRAELSHELYNKLHGEVEYGKENIKQYLAGNPEVIDLIQEIIISNELLMEREEDLRESGLPTSINSYILIVASFLVDQNGPDLTYGLANVSDQELDYYFMIQQSKLNQLNQNKRNQSNEESDNNQNKRNRANSGGKNLRKTNIRRKSRNSKKSQKTRKMQKTKRARKH
jgi:hypothetical protein